MSISVPTACGVTGWPAEINDCEVYIYLKDGNLYMADIENIWDTEELHPTLCIPRWLQPNNQEPTVETYRVFMMRKYPSEAFAASGNFRHRQVVQGLVENDFPLKAYSLAGYMDSESKGRFEEFDINNNVHYYTDYSGYIYIQKPNCSNVYRARYDVQGSEENDEFRRLGLQIMRWSTTHYLVGQ